IRHGAWDLPEEFHYTTWTAERTIAAIERDVAAGVPFFTWSSFHDPHPPYLVPEPWASMYDPADMEPGTLQPGELDLMPEHHRLTQVAHGDFSRWMDDNGHINHGFEDHRVSDARMRQDMAIYYGMISFMDQQIGRILDRLESLGILQDTLIVFTTDHGHFLGQHGLTAKGAFHYEDLIRLPFLVAGPGVPANRRSDAIQSLVDLAPTFLDAAGIPIPGIMQGVSQVAVWQGRADAARTWAIVENRHQPTRLTVRTYVEQRYKATVYRSDDAGELFDLVADPDERVNRWDDPAYAAIQSELLHRWLQAELSREPTRYPRIAHA
ncbi:MAG: sulfatase-like hydrolase/transferase, partial [Thermomicrobiales bacterium]